MRSGIGRRRIVANWKHRLPVKDLLTEDDSPEATKIAATLLHTMLEEFRLAHYPEDDDIEVISDQFHTLAYVDEQPSCREFNLILSELYDWADVGHRLWCGL